MPYQVAENLNNASETEIKLALFFCANRDAGLSDAAAALGISKNDAEAANAFWRGALSSAGSPVKAEKTYSRKTGDAPDYSGAQLAEILTNGKGLAGIMDECQRLLCKTFTAHDTEVYVGCLYDWLGLSPEYILLLTSYCCDHGKKNVRYIEKTAISLHDEGIDNYEKLELYIADAEKRGMSEYRLRKLFGFGERALTASEKKHFAKFEQTPFELVECAYGQMIKNIGEVKLGYLAKILDNWSEKGIKTVGEAQNESMRKSESSEGAFSQKSFEFDDFLSAAIKSGTKKKGKKDE